MLIRLAFLRRCLCRPVDIQFLQQTLIETDIIFRDDRNRMLLDDSCLILLFGDKRGSLTDLWRRWNGLLLLGPHFDGILLIVIFLVCNFAKLHIILIV